MSAIQSTRPASQERGRTPQRPAQQQSTRRRRFGTLLSVNSPTPPRPKTVVRPRQSSPEETIVFENGNTTSTVVHFDQGPIGLKLQPAQSGEVCVVLECVAGGAADCTGKIQPGDIVVAVNDQHNLTYQSVLSLLENHESERRTLTFHRPQRQLESPAASFVPLPDSEDSFKRRSRHKRIRTPSSTPTTRSPKTGLDAIRRQVHGSRIPTSPSQQVDLRLQALASENERLKERKAEFQEQIKILNQQYTNLEQESNRRLSLERSHHDAQEQKLQELKEQLDLVTQEKLAAQENQRTTTIELEQHNAKLHEYLETSHEKINALGQEMAKIREAASHKQATLQDEIQRLSVALQTADNQKEQTTLDLEQQNAQLRDSIQDQNENIQQLEQEATKARESASLERTALQGEIQRLSLALQTADNEKQTWLLEQAKERKAYDKQMDDIQTAHQNSMEGHHRVSRELKSHQTVLEQENERLRVAVDDMKRSCQKAAQEKELLESNLVASNKARSRSERRIQELASWVGQLENSTQSKDKDLLQRQSDLHNVRRELEATKLELTRLRIARESSTRTVEVLESQVEELKRQNKQQLAAYSSRQANRLGRRQKLLMKGVAEELRLRASLSALLGTLSKPQDENKKAKHPMHVVGEDLVSQTNALKLCILELDSAKSEIEALTTRNRSLARLLKNAMLHHLVARFKVKEKQSECTELANNLDRLTATTAQADASLRATKKAKEELEALVHETDIEGARNRKIEEALQSKLNEAEVTISSLSQENDELCAQTDRWQQNHKSLLKQWESTKTVNASLQSEFHSISARLEKAEKSLHEERMSMQVMKSDHSTQRIQSKQAELDLQDKIKTLRAQVTEARLKQRKSQDNFEIATTKLEAIQENSKAVCKRNEQLLSELETMKSSLDSSKRSLDSQSSQVTSLKQSMAAQEISMKRELKLKEEALCQATLATQQVASELGGLKLELTDLQVRLKTSEQARASSEEDALCCRKEIENTSASAKATETQLRTQISEGTLEIQALRAEVLSKDVLYLEVSAKVEASAKENLVLRKELGKTKSWLAEAKKHLGSVELEFSKQLRSEVKQRETLDEKWSHLVKEKSAELASSQGIVSDLKTEIRMLERNGAKIEKDNLSLKAQAREFCNMVKDLNSALTEKGKEIFSISSEVESSNETVERLRSQLFKNEQQNALLIEDRRRSESELTNVRSKFELITAELKANVENETTRANCLETAIHDLEITKGISEKETQRIAQSLADSQQELESLKKQLRSAKDQLEEQGTRYEDEQAIFQNELSELRVEIQKAVELADQREKECKMLTAERVLLTSTLCARDQQLKESTEKAEEYADAHETATNRFRESLASVHEKSSASFNEILEVRSKLDREKNERQVIERRHGEEIVRMKFDLGSKERAFQDLSRRYDIDRNDLRLCKIDLASSISEVKELLGCIADQKSEHKVQVQALTEQHKKEVASVVSVHQEKYGSLFTAHSTVQEALKQSRNEVNKLSYRLTGHKRHIEKLGGEVRHLREENSSLLSQLEDSNNTIAELRCDLESIENKADDSGCFGSPLKGMSRLDLKAKCLDLQSELGESLVRVGVASSDADRRSEHVKRLACDLQLMTNEIDNLVGTNESLERKLKDAWSQQELVENLLMAEVDASKDSQERSLSLEKAVQRLTDENNLLLGRQREVQSTGELEVSQWKCRADNLEEALTTTAAMLRTAENQRAEEEKSRSLIEKSLDEFKSQLAMEIDRSAEIELDKNCLKHKLKEREHDNVILLEKLKTMTNSLSQLGDECSSLRRAHLELEVELVCARQVVEQKETSETEMQLQIQLQREEARNNERMRADAESKLSDASRCVAAQKDTIETLANEREEREANIATLEQDMTKAQTNLQTLKSSYEEKIGALDTQYLLLEEQCVSLEDLLETSRGESRALREKVQDERRKSYTMNKLVESQKTKLASSQAMIESFRVQLTASREKLDGSTSACTKLQAELDGKTMEIDHLRAKIQILSASSSRLKSELVVLCGQSESQQNEVMNVTQDGLELLEFVELTFDRTEGSLAKLCHESQQFDLDRNTLRVHVDALDLAGLESRKQILTTFSATIEGLRCFLAQARSRLEDQKHLLENSNGNAFLPHSPAKHVLDKVRNTVYDHHLDDSRKVETLRRVIQSLEEELDGLVEDLRSTNHALSEKDRMFSNLEEIVETQEDTKASLEKQVQTLKATVLENNSPCDCNLLLKSECKRCASRLLLNAIEARETAAKAVAFRQWACQVSAMRALSKQDHSADILSHELKETREKLKILKRHLKKTRRGPKDTSLDCIAEVDSDTPNAAS